MNEINTVLNNIKALRKLHKLTQASLAEKIGKSHSYIRQFESGQVEPSFTLLKDIAKAFDVSIGDLFIDHEKPKASNVNDNLLIHDSLKKLLSIPEEFLDLMAKIDYDNDVKTSMVRTTLTALINEKESNTNSKKKA